MGQRELECCVKGPILHHLDFTRFWRPWFPNFLNEFIDRRVELCEHCTYYVLNSLGPANISMGLVKVIIEKSRGEVSLMEQDTI